MSNDFIRARIEEVNKQPCTCVSCGSCNGNGTYRVDLDGRPTRHMDDLYDLENCDQCQGGISEECDRCAEIGQLYSEMEGL